MSGARRIEDPAKLPMGAADLSTALEMTDYACRDDQIRFLVIPSVTESEVERRRIGCW